MPRNLKRGELQKRTAGRRQFALDRRELRAEASPRESAAGPVSHAVKSVDPETADMIAAFLQNRRDKA